MNPNRRTVTVSRTAAGGTVRKYNPVPWPEDDPSSWLGYGRPLHMVRDFDEFIFDFAPYSCAPLNMPTVYVDAPPETEVMGHAFGEATQSDLTVVMPAEMAANAQQKVAAEQQTKERIGTATYAAIGVLIGAVIVMARRRR